MQTQTHENHRMRGDVCAGPIAASSAVLRHRSTAAGVSPLVGFIDTVGAQGLASPSGIVPPYSLLERSRELCMRSRVLRWQAHRICVQSSQLRNRARHLRTQHARL
jgi:hypothetical protein